MAISPEHSFAVCAYGKSPYLHECLNSICNQTESNSEIYIATSTPSDWLENIAAKFDLPVYINHGEKGIGQDWSFAYSCASTPFVTIAHQDDVYNKEYACRAIRALSGDASSLIYFTDYGELRNGIFVDDNRLLRVKRALLAPLKHHSWARRTFAKRSALRFGSAICCPSVTYNVANCPNPPFVVGMKSNLDWATWELLSRTDGSFIYDYEKPLIHHRIHEGSATSELIASKERDAEDLEMLKCFWPPAIASLIERLYSKGAQSNEL